MDRSLRVLYVEDEPDIQEIARMALETLGGFELQVCSGGVEALEVAAGFGPDIVLLDVMMPGMDGIETLDALRRLPELSGVPMVFMTAKVQPREESALRGVGAVDVIPKPFDPLTLADEVRAIWSRHAGPDPGA